MTDRTRKYFRLMLGRKSIHAQLCFSENFVGLDWFPDTDFSGEFPENWKEFNKKYVPIYLEQNPDKSKVAAGLACGMTHTLCKNIGTNDIVMCPDGIGNYRFGKILGDYYFKRGEVLPHRRNIQWLDIETTREALSDDLKNSTGSIATIADISKHHIELEKILNGATNPVMISSDPLVEDASAFAMEKHLEDFLVENWSTTELSQNYDIVSDEGELVGQQFPTDTGPIDILAISKDKKEFLVIELKKGRASDSVVGQIQRYMGYVMEEFAEEHQSVKGCIIAFEDDLRIKRALKINPSIDFYKYEISFRLKRVD